MPACSACRGCSMCLGNPRCFTRWRKPNRAASYGLSPLIVRPAPRSIGGDLFVTCLHAGVQHLVMFKQDGGAEQRGIDRPRSRRELGLERRRQKADLQAEAGVKMARRQAVHLSRRQMHLRHADGSRSRNPQEPAKILVRPGRRCHVERRLRGGVQPETAATGSVSLLASGYRRSILPSSPGDMRTKPIGTGPFKFVEFKANESIKLVRNPGLLEEGPAAPRTASSSPSSRTARRPFSALFGSVRP